MPPENQVRESGYLTPDNASESAIWRSFHIPNDTAWLGLFMGVLASALPEEAWRKYGELTPEECAEIWQTIFFSWESAPGETVDTPFWDDAEDVDDELPADDQPWYGQVADAAVAPTELTFIENAFVWSFTGLIVASLGGIPGVAPALAFRTIASRFILSFRNGGTAGDVIRFFVDGVKVFEGVSTGDESITDVTVIADPDMDDHQIYITGDSA